MTVIIEDCAKSCDDVCGDCWAALQLKENEEKDQEGFPEEMTHGTES